jgi:hypothetical protein
MVVKVGGVGGVGAGGGRGAEDAVLNEGLVKGAFGGGLVSLKGGEGVVGVAGVTGEEMGGGAGVGERVEVGWGRGGLDAVAVVVGELLVVPGLGGAVGGLDLVAVVLVGEVEEAGFGLGVAAEFPSEEGDAFDEEVFEGGLRVKVVAEIEEEIGVVGLLSLGDEEGGVEGGAEAVAEGVAGGAGLALGGAGAGGVEGVGAVGEEGFGGGLGVDVVVIREH